jgi:integrase
MSSPSVHAEPSSAVRPATLNALFEEYAAYSLRVRSTAPETVAAQRLYLDRIAVSLSAKTAAGLCRAFTPARLMAAVADYASGHAPASRRWMQWTLRSLLRFCHVRGYVRGDLSEWVPAFRSPRLASIPKAIPEATIGSLLASVDPQSPHGRRDAAIIQLLATYGIRGLQLRQLRLTDLDWEAGRVRFPACKRGKDIVQALTVEAGNRLSDYIRLERPAAAGRPEVFLGATPPYDPLTGSAGLSDMIHTRLRQAGLQVPEGVSRGTHGFRHAFACRLCGKVPLKHISDMLGHRDLASVLVYAKVNFEELAHAALAWPEAVAP